MLFQFLLISHIGQLIEFLILNFIWKILLLYIVIRIIVGILIADSMTQLLMPAVVCILEIYRHCGLGALHAVHRCKDRIHSGVALRRACHISSSLGSKDHNTSCNKLHIFPCIQHLRKIIHCSIRV